MYSENRQLPCRSNCEDSNGDRKPFFCILCGQNEKSKNKVGNGILRRWHEVLLPEAIEPKWEMVWFKDTEMNRQVEPAYLDPHGFVLLPHIHSVIAMVLAHEMSAEAELKEHIRRLLGSIMPEDKDVVIVAVEYSENFLAFHTNFKFADMRVLAACAVHLVLFQSSKLLEHHAMRVEFNAPDCPGFNDLVELAADKIHIWSSRLMMLDLGMKLTANVGRPQREAVASGTDMAHRVWMESVKGTQWSRLV